MRPLPRLTEIPRYPVIALTALLAVGVSVAHLTRVDISVLYASTLVRRGEIWRLVTNIFPHFNIFHLIFNLCWLWVFGTIVEEKFGHLKTAGLILLFAFGSGALQFGFAVRGSGLSGVVYGFFGLLSVLSQRDERFHESVGRKTIQFFAAWFVLGVLLTLIKLPLPHVGSISNVARGAGLVLGILTAFAITLPDGRVVLNLAISAILLLGLWTATLGRPMVNRAGLSGYEEGQWGHAALEAHRDMEASRWLHDAVVYEPGNREYWYELGIAYQRLGDVSDSVDAYRKAADLGEAESEYFVGAMYASGSGGLPQNDGQAVYWYRKAADQGNSDAENSLGVMYDYGRGGLTKDAMQALYWYHKSADQGNPTGENDLAWLCAISSDPAIRNPAIALEYAHKAVNATKDHPNPNFIDTLAEAYYVNAQYENAVHTEERAIALLPPTTSTEYRNDFIKRLEKYQKAFKKGKR